jgi:hypothetical protein
MKAPGRLIVFLAVIAALAYAAGVLRSRVDISDINSSPDRYDGRMVSVSGTAANSLGVLGAGMYELTDETGSIPVLSQNGVPTEGARVRIKGRVHKAFTVGPRAVTVIVQEKDS